MRDRLVKLLATCGGAGYLPKAPGLAGSVVGLGYWWLLRQLPGDVWYWLITAAGAALAVWCTGQAARLLGQDDPPQVVLDEIVAVPLALALGSGWWLALAFVLFRVFDVWKPGFVGDAQKLTGGWGIVVDDLLAAALACVTTFAVAGTVTLLVR